MLDTPFAPWPQFSDDAVETVAGVLRTGSVNYWTGQESRVYKAEFANWAGTTNAVANGTLALDLALIGHRICGRHGDSPHDDMTVAPRTSLASAGCVIIASASRPSEART